MKWLNNYRRVGVKFRGPRKYMDVPKRLISQADIREPFMKFMRSVFDFMSTGDSK
jgi:hypothetical protein